MLLLLAFAFLAGIVTIISPCILPILPIVLSGSVGGSRRKPLGIILGFIISFTFFTLFLTEIVRLTGIPSNTLRIIAGIVLLIFGVSLLIPGFQRIMEKLFTKLSVFAPKANPNAGFWGGIVIGMSIGLIWTPCVGPILASVIALAATSKVTLATFLITFFYSLGSAIPMFFIMYGGRNLLNKAPWLIKNSELIQRIFGVLMIVMSIVIFTNIDQQFEAYIATTPYGADLTNLENNSAVTKQLDLLKGISNTTGQYASGLFNADTPAPEFTGINQWLNNPNGAGTSSQPLTLASLKGKVVLVDFWTYTCINCIRTLPYVTTWYDKYKDDGFVVVGIHTPEFAFEHETSNVENAIKQYNIHYPVAQDNDYATWNAYNNEYWPAEYLIDENGIIRRTEFGEGNYPQMEMAIQTLLKQAGKKTPTTISKVNAIAPSGDISPETYLGSARMMYLYPNGSTDNGTQTFTLNENVSTSTFSYGGQWTISDDSATAGKDAAILYDAKAERVYIILRPNGVSNGTVKVLLDGKPISSAVAGSDVKNGIVTVDSDRLYNIVDFHTKIETHKIQLDFQSPGIQAYTFTFG